MHFKYLRDILYPDNEMTGLYYSYLWQEDNEQPISA